jgi:hypothetical protein
MNFVAGALLLVLTGGGQQQQQQQQHCSSSSSSTAPASQPDAATAPGRPCRVSSNSSGEDPAAAAAAAAAGLEGPEALAFGCLLAVAEHVLPGYYSPAMVAPQVGALLCCGRFCRNYVHVMYTCCDVSSLFLKYAARVLPFCHMWGAVQS